ncbi:MAG: glycosyltransferase family 2 protein [Patescibacteria group bacterium]|nr:glycosyltransferase family 2 protein [Patescibacteria group bacterium]
MSFSKSQVGIVIPAYNEANAIGGVLENLKQNNYENILVVDDGSSDDTYAVAKKSGVRVIRHSLNRGLGGALGTGIQAAVLLKWPIIITFDADGQHDVKDIYKVALPLSEGKADAVIGSRMKDNKGMPWYRILFNKFGNFVTFVLFGMLVSDSQSGLRGFSLEAARKIQIKTNRMEVSSEIIREIKVRKLNLKEVPIKAIYTDYSLSKGQSLLTGIRTFFKLLLHRLIH